MEIHPLTHRAAQHGALKRCTRCGAFMPRWLGACQRDGARLEAIEDHPAPGGTISVYRVDALLGAGGMGEVFSAEHALIGRRVAVKVLHKRLAQDVVLVRRFLREARAASRLRHPNILEVTDFGLLAGGRPFMIMERIVGESLDERLVRGGALPLHAALRIAHALALALRAAHDVGVIHNDLKPDNVMLLAGSTDEDPRLKLVDFGAASIVDDGVDADDLTIGTPHYMSPERARGAVGDERADLYALGVVLFEMLTGHVPFTGASAAAILYAHTRAPIPEAASPFGLVPAGVSRILRRALTKAPEARYGSAAEMLLDLEAALAVTSRSGWRRLLP